MKKTPQYVTKIAWGFVLSAGLILFAAALSWNSAGFFEFILQRNLPGFYVTGSDVADETTSPPAEDRPPTAPLPAPSPLPTPVPAYPDEIIATGGS